MKFRNFSLIIGAAGLLAATAQAQFTAGNLAVLRAGDNSTNPWSSLDGAKQSPVFVDEFDPAMPINILSTNMYTNGPMFSVAIPITNAGALWFNGHAGSEGYFARSEDESTMSFSGYAGNILAVPGTPSSLPINRGICVIDVMGNNYLPYQGTGWYGFFDNIQANPRGVVSDTGSNNFFGSGSTNGNMWYQYGGGPPLAIQNLNSTRDIKIIGGVFYTSLQAGDGGTSYPPGIYNFQNSSLGFPVGLPEGDDFTPNLVVPASPLYPNVEGFDLNPQRDIAYMADNTYGIQKYIEVGGNWQLACAFGVTNNTSTGVPSFPVSYTGCLGLVVDWSGSYPVVFATTTEGGTLGYANSNRLIRLDDNYNFTDGLLHTNGFNVTTLATAWGDNVVFRGLAWTPDRRPVITSNPASQSVVAGAPATFTVAATANFTNTYEWLVDGAQDSSQTTSNCTVSSTTLGQSGSTYQVIVSNTFGAVTSTVATLSVTAGLTAPSLTSPMPALNLTNAIYDTITLPVSASGTTPLTYQWWQVTSQGATLLSDNGGDFTGTATGTLTIKASAPYGSASPDSGSYYVVINNATGTPSSNLVAAVSIVTPLPVVFVEPVASIIAASNGVATFTALAYPLDATYQWYYQATPESAATPVSGAQWVVSQFGATLTATDVQGSNAGSYFVVVSDLGGSITSAVESLTVETPAPYSALPYTSLGLVYQQNFDSLPDPGTSSVNASTGVETEIPAVGGTNYFVNNPFDFAAPLSVTGDNGKGGLGLSNSMVGWYSSDLGNEQIQATSGDQTTGLIVSFGCLNATNTVNPLYPTNNRALGMLSSPATSGGGSAGDAADGLFALRIRNLTGQTLSNMNLSYVSELWRNTVKTNIMTNYYYVDPYGTNTTPTNNWTGGLTNIFFPTNIGGITAPGVTPAITQVFGTNAPIATTNMSFVNMPLATNWPPGGVLWIVWEETTALSGAQGYGIDNLVFSSGPPTLGVQQTNVLGTNSVVLSWPQMFTNAVLLSNPNLSNPSGWQSVTNMPEVFDGMNYVTLPAAGTQQFFLLGD